LGGPETRRKLRLIGYGETKATEITRGIYNCPKLTGYDETKATKITIGVKLTGKTDFFKE
jgi:hypothetical protein